MKAFRTIPVLMEVAEEVHEVCPDAWMIYFTNPAGAIYLKTLLYQPQCQLLPLVVVTKGSSWHCG